MLHFPACAQGWDSRPELRQVTSSGTAHTLPARLRLAFGLSGLISLVLCTAAVVTLAGVDRHVTGLTNIINFRAAPASDLMRAADAVTLATNRYLRAHTVPDYSAALAEFTRARRQIGSIRIGLAASEEGAAMATSPATLCHVWNRGEATLKRRPHFS